MASSDTVRMFAKDVGLDPTVGGAGNVQDALAGIPTGGLTVVRHPFDHTQHAALAAGVLVATLPDGAFLVPGACIWSIATAFNGMTPNGCVTGTQADAVSLSHNLFGTTDPTQADSAQSGNAYQVSDQLPSPFIATGGPMTVWFAITDGSSGDPGSTAGAGELVLVYVT